MRNKLEEGNFARAKSGDWQDYATGIA